MVKTKQTLHFGRSNLRYIINYCVIPLNKASSWNSIAFSAESVTSLSAVASNELLASAPVFIKYSYKIYFQLCHFAKTITTSP